jgi:hypothetical protein
MGKIKGFINRLVMGPRRGNDGLEKEQPMLDPG